MTSNDLLLTITEKQMRLIAVQAQLLDRLRKFGDEGASELHREAHDLTLELEQLHRAFCARERPAVRKGSGLSAATG